MFSPLAFTGADITDMIHCLVMGWMFSASWIRTKGSMWLEIQQGQLTRDQELGPVSLAGAESPSWGSFWDVMVSLWNCNPWDSMYIYFCFKSILLCSLCCYIYFFIVFKSWVQNRAWNYVMWIIISIFIINIKCIIIIIKYHLLLLIICTFQKWAEIVFIVLIIIYL